MSTYQLVVRSISGTFRLAIGFLCRALYSYSKWTKWHVLLRNQCYDPPGWQLLYGKLRFTLKQDTRWNISFILTLKILTCCLQWPKVSNACFDWSLHRLSLVSFYNTRYRERLFSMPTSWVIIHYTEIWPSPFLYAICICCALFISVYISTSTNKHLTALPLH